MIIQNPFNLPEVANHYEDWYQTPGRRAEREEKALLRWLLNHFSHVDSILEVGSGTGHFTRWFNHLGLQAIGLDLASHMLVEAKKNHCPRLVLGDGHYLPFCSKSIDLAVLITTLEFVSNPYQILAEILRIARQGIILGVINRHSVLGQKYRQMGGQVWDKAHFFTSHELKRMLQHVTEGKCRIVWRTTLWPFFSASLPLPWGGFIGLGAILFTKGEECRE